MLVLHGHGLIFLHGRKTAGSSVGISLMRYADRDDIARGYITGGLAHGIEPPGWGRSLRWLRPVDLAGGLVGRTRREGKRGKLADYSWRTELRIRAYRRYANMRFGVGGTHVEIPAAREIVGDELWRSYVKFTIIRDPWDRMISFYSWRTKEIPERPSFRDFVKAIWSVNAPVIARYNARGYSNSPFLFEGGRLAVDRVVRFERLRHDLEELCQDVDLPFDGWLPHNKSGVRLPDVEHDQDTIQMVREIERDVIAHFGYSWDESRVNPRRAEN